MPVLKLGDVVPNFDAETTEGKMNFHSWLGGKYFDFTIFFKLQYFLISRIFLLGSWAILFSHPADYTPVCTTELGRVQKLVGEFQKRGMKVCNNII